jgi:aminoglycoside 6'-N-acetyltransferase I
MLIERCTHAAQPGWLELRAELWSAPREEELAEMAAMAAAPQHYGAFVAYSEQREPLALAEVARRVDYVNGAQTSPLAFLEALCVVPHARGRGIATALVAQVCRWAKEQGLRELASDAAFENVTSHGVHRALGFEETERVVFYRKPI